MRDSQSRQLLALDRLPGRQTAGGWGLPRLGVSGVLFTAAVGHRGERQKRIFLVPVSLRNLWCSGKPRLTVRNSLWDELEWFLSLLLFLCLRLVKQGCHNNLGWGAV